MRMNGEDPDGVDMGAMPRQRRRREKKLMTIDEVNERFPLTKYKIWRSSRAQEGLSTAGGINAATSRPASVKDLPTSPPTSPKQESSEAERAKSPELNEKTAPTTDTGKEEPSSSSQPNAVASTSETRPSTAVSKKDTTSTPLADATTNDTEHAEDDDDHIQNAVPTEQLPDPGDACAICIDTLEDEDDVRGLQCGHAFHGSCVDPWLTSRRACCPLCKADYYVPKPRPEGAEGESIGPRRMRADGSNVTQPQFAMISGGRGGARPVMILPGRFMSIVYDENDPHGFPRVVREPRPPRLTRAERRQHRSMSTATTTTGGEGEQTTTDTAPEQQRTWVRRFTDFAIPNPLRRNNEDSRRTDSTAANAQTNTTETSTVTPGQLEAGRANR